MAEEKALATNGLLTLADTIREKHWLGNCWRRGLVVSMLLSRQSSGDEFCIDRLVFTGKLGSSRASALSKCNRGYLKKLVRPSSPFGNFCFT